MYLILMFLYGISFGSFFNVCIYRIPLKKSIVKPNSHCFSCNTELKFKDMIPVLGYFLNKGKCNYCGEKYSIRYSLVELLTGILFVLTYIEFGFSLKLIFALLIISILIIIAFIDLDHMIIPDGLNLLLLGIGIIYTLVFKEFTIIELLIAFLLGGGIFLLISIIGPLGGGDIKLISVLSLVFGPINTIMVMQLSFIIGGIISVLLLIFKVKKRKDYIPFAPFIVIAAILTLLYYNEIFLLYLKLIS